MGYKFDTPKNSQDNEKLKAAKGVGNTWLNINNLATEGRWLIPENNRQVNASWNDSGDSSTNNPHYTLTLVDASYVEINLISAIDTYLYLLDENGNQIASNDDGGSGYNSRLALSLSAVR